MAMNELSFNQVSTLLTSIVEQATGAKVLTPTNTSEFVTVAKIGLESGYDNIIGAINQVLSKTIFSERPYTRKFKGLEADAITFGNHVRKLQIADKDWEDDDRMSLQNGQSVDQQVVNMPDVLQTNFYGQNVYSRHYTMFKDQLDTAFSKPEEFARFNTLVMTNCSDMIEQAHEDMARMALVNLIGGIIAANQTDRVVHLLTEYNAATGLSLDGQTVYKPENFKPFMQWVYARVAAISSLMTERSEKFQTNIVGKEIKRHTPENKQRVYLFAPSMYQSEAQVLADTYHDNYLRLAVKEKVNFWQSINTPSAITVRPTYMATDGSLVSVASTADPVTADRVFGLITDEETAGYTSINQWSSPAPFNARGGYTNIWFHFTDRYWNDFTEKAVVLLLD